jgi:hypothetical protein
VYVFIIIPKCVEACFETHILGPSDSTHLGIIRYNTYSYEIVHAIDLRKEFEITESLTAYIRNISTGT